MVRRKNSPLYDSFLLCRNSIRKDLSHIAHKRRNTRFNGLWRVHTPPQPLNAHTAPHRAKHGAFQVGVLSLHSDRFVWVGDPARPDGRTVYFAAFGPWSGVLPKSAESLRDSDVLMCVAVPQASRPRWAALSLPVIVHRRALGGCHRCDKGQRTLLAGLLSFCLRCRGFFFGYSAAFLEPLFASIHARNLSFGTTIRLPILSAGKRLLRASS